MVNYEFIFVNSNDCIIIPAKYIKETDLIIVYLDNNFINYEGEFIGQSFEQYFAYLLSHEHLHRLLDKINESVEYKYEEKVISLLDIFSGLMGDYINENPFRFLVFENLF